MSRSPQSSEPQYRDLLLSFREEPIRRDPDIRAPTPTTPLHLLDRHIPESLILKRIVRVESLVLSISTALDRYSDRLDALDDGVFGLTPADECPPVGYLSTQIADYRKYGIGYTVTSLASRVVLHPKQQGIPSRVRWTPCPGRYKPILLYEPYVDQRDAFTFRQEEHMLEPEYALHAKAQAILDGLVEHAPHAISSMFMCTDAEVVLRGMSALTDSDVFPWKLDSSCTITRPPCSPPPDADEDLWSLPKPNAPRRSARSRLKLMDSLGLSVGNVKPRKQSLSDPTTDDGPDASDYVQKAWSCAVYLDATVVVFDCGNFIRIGIRHRERQTLYLSDIFDVSSSESPAYGRLWTALHILAVQDAVSRLPSLHAVADSARYDLAKRKRSLFVQDPSVSASPRKRRNTGKNKGKGIIPDSTKIIKQRLDSSPVIALFFQFGIYDSPAPTLLWAPGSKKKEQYEPADYLRIVLDAQMGSGAIGDVFRAVIYGDEPSNSSFIVKVASTSYKVQRLKHEHRVYSHLNTHGVKGIPAVLGFYENDDDGVCILALTNVGQALGLRMDKELKVTLLPAQREQLLKILSDIHQAGVLHRDIRSWNMLIDQAGELYIADFDRASFRGTDANYAAEKERMRRFAEGRFVDEEKVIGEDDVNI